MTVFKFSAAIRWKRSLSSLACLAPMFAAAGSAVAADPAACVWIGVDSERLLCYDRALDRTKAIAGLSRAPSDSPPPTVDPDTAPVVIVPTPASDTTVSIAGAGTPTLSANVDAFGKEAVPAPTSRPVEKTSDRIQARIVGAVDGLRAGQELVLDNGQHWAVIDDRDFDLVAEQPQVTLWRNLIGSYWLRVEPRGAQVRVRRLK